MASAPPRTALVRGGGTRRAETERDDTQQDEDRAVLPGSSRATAGGPGGRGLRRQPDGGVARARSRPDRAAPAAGPGAVRSDAADRTAGTRGRHPSQVGPGGFTDEQVAR